MVSKDVEEGLLTGFQTPNGGPMISHLLYADDAMILGGWSKENLEKMNRILSQDIEEIAGVIGCKSGKMSFIHLGILVWANMNNVHNWNGIIDIFEKRLAAWKAHSLSIGGRVVLIKAVLEKSSGLLLLHF
ncbi:uncharacterized protein LOC143636126 [Bidens hawaiensis]|uniref:uncharacterized protein LOC143636126 n=1 Tax=Bidens hawaiensis TaxID=980011 RepID=UPI0040497C38